MVLKNNQRTAMAAALMLSMGLSACGKKKDLITPVAQTPTKTVAEAPATPIGVPTSAPGELPAPSVPVKAPTTENTNGQAGQGLPEPGKGPKPAPVPPKSPAAGTTTPPKAGTPQGTLPPPQYRPVGSTVTTGAPAGSGAQTVAPVAPTADKATGVVGPNGTVFTRAANDGLIEFLKGRNRRVDATSQRLNIETARSVMSAKLSLDPSSDEATVSVVLMEGSEPKVYNLSGVTSYGPATGLRTTGAGALGTTTGLRAVEGSLKCLDFDGGCSTVFVRMKVGTTGSSSILNIVFRTTPVALHFDLVSNGNSNPEYTAIADLVKNSIQGTASANYIKTAMVSSFEVPHGRSGFEFSIETGAKEFIGFGGDLVSAPNSTSANVPMARLAPSIENGQLSNLAKVIGDARLVSNDSAGTLKMDLRLRKKGAGKPEQVKVTLVRDLAPIVDLNEESLK